MLANTLSFVNLALPPTAQPPVQPPALAQPSASSQFSRLLDQQATQRRDAERSEASKAANREPAPRPSTEPVPNPDTAGDNRSPDDINSRADSTSKGPVPPPPSTAASKSDNLRTARQPGTTSKTADDAGTPTPATAAGRPVKPGADDTGKLPADGNGGCFPEDSDDAGAGTVCEATPLALVSGPTVPVPTEPVTPPTRLEPGAPGNEGSSAGNAGNDRSARRLGAAGPGDRLPPLTAREDRPATPATSDDAGAVGSQATRLGPADAPAVAPGAAARSFAAELQALLPGAAVANADTPLASAGAAADVPTEGRLHASPGSPEFAGALGAQLTTFIADGVHHARLELNPADMGPVTVQIQIDGQQARVHLAADNADTRQALEQALPQLAGSLRESGLTLSGGGVYDQPQPQPRQPQGGDARQEHGPRAPDGGWAEAANGPAPTRTVTVPARRGVVDLVA